ncbi:uncharacterized protein LOC119352925 [Triticum dicoccoides]|uniref:uncharacterized protein LOC119352925 n=1 Tax=Triticum dicoccoides TaxID=85692 RepID=UPI000E79C6F6|nr:uncharacterized protein LOC119352925 [Triticum dicoccoides]
MEQRQSITMSKLDSSGVTVLDDLPESIIVGEILIRLPAEDILRCRAVCKLWCHATSAHDFLLAHHRRQPSLLLIDCLNRDNRFCDGHLCVFCGDHAGSTGRKLCRPILWYADHTQDVDSLTIHAACDGLLIVSYEDHDTRFDICNPTTRQRAPLLLLPGPRCRASVKSIHIAGFYQHCPSREYRVLYSIWTRNENGFSFTADFYVLSVGSDEPKPIGHPPMEQDLLDGHPPMEQCLLDGLTCSSNISVLHRGSLHWGLERYHSDVRKILVFDTADETFRWMSRPTGMSFWTLLLEIDSVLAMCTSHNGIVVDIHMMQDYEAEVWAFKYRIDLSALKASLPLDLRVRCLRKIAVLDKHELLIELDAGHLVHCDIDGEFLGHVKCSECEESHVHIKPYRFQENIIPLPFLEMQDDYVIPEAEDDDEIHYFIWPYP